MGDRVLVQFKNGKEVSPVIYGHWCGSEAPALIVALREQMDTRNDDLAYIAARCVQQFIGGDKSQTGFGIWSAEKELTAEDTHGDAGVYVVEIGATWTVNHLCGYEPDNMPTHPRIKWTRSR
jgi:hypothetical protein